VAERAKRIAVTAALLSLSLGVSGIGPLATQSAQGLENATASPTSTLPGSPRLTTSAPTFLAQSISFTSATDAWLLGMQRCTAGWCTTLRHSVNGGATWTRASAPATSIGTGTSVQVSELHFATPTAGYAFGPGLWVTHDAGAHWHRPVLPGEVVALATTTTEAYAVVAPCWPFTATSCSSPSRLYHSRVGSDAWHPVPGVTIPPSASPAALDVSGSAVYLLVAAGKYLLGAPDGLHFSHVAVPCPRTATGLAMGPVDLALTSATRLAVLCAGGVAAGSEGKKVYVSSDGGRRFHQIATPPFGGDVGQLVAAGPSTLLVAARSGASEIYRTSGADTTWTTPITIGDGGMGFVDLAFSDALHGAMIHGPADSLVPSRVPLNSLPYPGQLYLTSDAGASWRRVVVSGE